MIQVTSSNFRNHPASIFALVDKGEEVVIRRRGKSAYMLTPYHQNDDFVITPELEKDIEEARREYRDGKTISFKTVEELQNYLDAL
jgi:antitoxin (DNA-binding transcriptional repressor) of toxin-antitoxin stability system